MGYKWILTRLVKIKLRLNNYVYELIIFNKIIIA